MMRTPEDVYAYALCFCDESERWKKLTAREVGFIGIWSHQSLPDIHSPGNKRHWQACATITGSHDSRSKAAHLFDAIGRRLRLKFCIMGTENG
jgi:hypothetical protein